MCGNVQNFLGTNTSDATWWPKLKLMQVKIEEEEKVEKKLRKNGRKKVEEKLKKNIARGTTDPGY